MFNEHKYKFLTGKHVTAADKPKGSVDRITLFDRALLNAGVGNYNLVKISSIIPPGFKEKKEKITLPEGSLLPIAYKRFYSFPHHGRVSAGIGVAVPNNDPCKCGVIIEADGFCSEMSLRERMENILHQAIYSREKEINLSEYDYKIEIGSFDPDDYDGNVAACVFAGVALL